MIKIEKIYPDIKLDTKITPSAFIVKAEDEDEPLAMTWFEAMEKFNNNLGSEYRLPTRSELLTMYENMDKIGGFDEDTSYWSSSETSNTSAWLQRFVDGNQLINIKSDHRLVRLVRKEIK